MVPNVYHAIQTSTNDVVLNQNCLAKHSVLWSIHRMRIWVAIWFTIAMIRSKEDVSPISRLKHNRTVSIAWTNVKFVRETIVIRKSNFNIVIHAQVEMIEIVFKLIHRPRLQSVPIIWTIVQRPSTQMVSQCDNVTQNKQTIWASSQCTVSARKVDVMDEYSLKIDCSASNVTRIPRVIAWWQMKKFLWKKCLAKSTRNRTNVSCTWMMVRDFNYFDSKKSSI